MELNVTHYEKKIDLKLILAILATGIMSFTGVVVETSMNVTFPTLMKQFAVGTSTVQWITTGYLLVLATVIPVSSYLKKRFTTRSLFLTAILLFIAGVILDAVTPVFSLLLLGRIIQGIGTGIALPLMFNIVLEQVPPKMLGTMMGISTMIIAVAPAVGPSLGGFIVSTLGWRMIFVVLLPLLIVSLILGLYSIRQISLIQKTDFDWTGYLFLASSFICLIFGTSMAGTRRWTSYTVLLLMAVCIAAMSGFIVHSRRSLIPVIQLVIFKNRSFTFSVLAVLSTQFICLSLGFLIPNYAQLVSGYNASLAGNLLLPGCALGALLTPLGGRLLDQLGARIPILIGNFAVILSTFCFFLLSAHLSTVLFIVFYLFFAIGQSLTMGNTVTHGLKQLPDNLNADGNAVLTTIQQIAGAIGTSVVTAFVSAAQIRMPDDLPVATQSGSREAFLLLSILSLFTLICTGGIFYQKVRVRKNTPTAEPLN